MKERSSRFLLKCAIAICLTGMHLIGAEEAVKAEAPKVEKEAPAEKKIWPPPMKNVGETPPTAFLIDMIAPDTAIVVTQIDKFSTVYSNWVSKTKEELLIHSVSLQGRLFVEPLVSLKTNHPQKEVRLMVNGGQLIRDDAKQDLEQAEVVIYFQSEIANQLGLPLLPEPRGTFLVRDGESVMFLIGFHARESEITVNRSLQMLIINSKPLAQAFRGMFANAIKSAPNTKLNNTVIENSPDLITEKNLKFRDDFNPQNTTTRGKASLPNR